MSTRESSTQRRSPMRLRLGPETEDRNKVGLVFAESRRMRNMASFRNARTPPRFWLRSAKSPAEPQSGPVRFAKSPSGHANWLRFTETALCRLNWVRSAKQLWSGPIGFVSQNSPGSPQLGFVSQKRPSGHPELASSRNRTPLRKPHARVPKPDRSSFGNLRLSP
jgi:hypothetical protein